jgi:hypothetical protein
VQQRVVGEDRGLQRAQVGTRLDADLADEMAMYAPVGLERIT